jgi:hypothetical protein
MADVSVNQVFDAALGLFDGAAVTAEPAATVRHIE